MRYSPCEHNLSSEGPTQPTEDDEESKEALSNLQEVNPVPWSKAFPYSASYSKVSSAPRDPWREIGTEKGNKRKLILKYPERSGRSHIQSHEVVSSFPASREADKNKTHCLEKRHSVLWCRIARAPAGSSVPTRSWTKESEIPSEPRGNNVIVYYLYNHQFILILKYRENFALSDCVVFDDKDIVTSPG